MRVVEGIPVDRARLRLTATYAVNERLAVGLEYNPLDDDLGPLVNLRVLDETENRPALMLGTSSDRIGTPSGRAYYATFSKDVEAHLGLPVAPYIGASFGEFEDEWELIGGLHVRWAEKWSSTHLWDGVNLHHILDWTGAAPLRAGVLVIEQDGEYYLGMSLGSSL